MQKQANAKELEEYKQRWKDAESKVMDVNSEKRAKIKSMSIILQPTQATLHQENELLPEKTYEVETMKNQMTLQLLKTHENLMFSLGFH